MNREINWNQNEILLHEILKKLEYLNKVASKKI